LVRFNLSFNIIYSDRFAPSSSSQSSSFEELQSGENSDAYYDDIKKAYSEILNFSAKPVDINVELMTYWAGAAGNFDNNQFNGRSPLDALEERMMRQMESMMITMFNQFQNLMMSMLSNRINSQNP